MGMGAGALGTMPWAAIAPARTSPDFGHFGHPDGPALWGYARNAPGMMVDPRGEWGPGGAMVGAALSMAVQTGVGMAWRGESFRQAVQNIDYRIVILSAAIGSASPGAVALFNAYGQPYFKALLGYQMSMVANRWIGSLLFGLGSQEPLRYDLPCTIESLWEKLKMRNSILWAFGV